MLSVRLKKLTVRLKRTLKKIEDQNGCFQHSRPQFISSIVERSGSKVEKDAINDHDDDSSNYPDHN